MLTVNQPVKELGPLKFGKEYNFYYIITNTYTEPVTIIKASVGCSTCTTASYPTSVLLPGETMKVDIKFTPNSTGIMSKYVDMVHKTSEEVKPSLRLSFRATVT